MVKHAPSNEINVTNHCYRTMNTEIDSPLWIAHNVGEGGGVSQPYAKPLETVTSLSHHGSLQCKRTLFKYCINLIPSNGQRFFNLYSAVMSCCKQCFRPLTPPQCILDVTNGFPSLKYSKNCTSLMI